MRIGAGAASGAVAVRLAALEPDTVRLPRTIHTDALLGRLCRTAREVLDVSRATILEFDEPGALVPAVSVAREDHDELWQRFRTMRPISLDVSPAAAEALSRGDVVVVPDAASSPLVPAEWRTAFSLTSLMVAPLHVEGRPWGALVVDDDNEREFGAHDVRALSELAGLAGIAIAATRLAGSAEAEAVLRGVLRDAVARLTVTADLAAAIDFVAPYVKEASGYELIGAAVREHRLTRVLNVGTMRGYDSDALRRLRSGDHEAIARGGRLLVPMRGVHGGLLGVLELRQHASASRRLELVQEVAERFAAVVAQLSASERERVRDVEAEHAAARLDLALRGMTRTLRTFRGAGYGQRTGITLFPVASANHAKRAVDELGEVREVLRAQGSSPSVTAALRSLLDPGEHGPYELHWASSGTPRAVGTAGEIAVLLTASRFLTLSLESRGRILGARVSFLQDGVECLLSSDGLLRDPAAAPGESAVERLGPWVHEIGGSVAFDAGEAAFSARLTLPYANDRTSTDRRPAPARARIR